MKYTEIPGNGYCRVTDLGTTYDLVKVVFSVIEDDLRRRGYEITFTDIEWEQETVRQ